MIQRNVVFTIFFVALIPGAFVMLKNPRLKLAALWVIPVFLFIHLIVIYTYSNRYNPPLRDQASTNILLYYLRNKTPEDAVILTNFELGPAIAYYSKRRVNLHSKFESQGIRDKVKKYYDKMPFYIQKTELLQKKSDSKLQELIGASACVPSLFSMSDDEDYILVISPLHEK